MKSVIMIGPSPAARGGMASVIQTYLAHGYEEGGRCRFIATHVDGGPLRKALRALAALLQFSVLLIGGRVAVLTKIPEMLSRTSTCCAPRASAIR